MGEIGSTLMGALQSIGGGSQGANPLAAYGGLEAGEINPGMKMFGMDQALGKGIPETGAIPGGNEDVAAVVSGFKPEKMNFWKRLADQFLIHQGQKPVYEQKVYDKNMRRAMEGFTQDPLETIRRIGTFDPKSAMTLYNQYVDNKRQDVQAQRTEMLIKERAWGRIASMMGSTQGDVNQYAKLVPILRRYAEQYDIDPSEIPEQYDESFIQSVRYGAVPVNQQMDDERLDRNADSLIESRQASTRRQDANTSSMINNRDRTFKESVRHNQVMENKPNGRGSSKSRLANKVFKDSSGSLVEFNKDGSKMKVTQPSGRIVYYGFDVNGNRVRIGVKEKE